MIQPVQRQPQLAHVHVVDGDARVRETLSCWLHGANVVASVHATGLDFLRHFDGHRHGCVILDLRPPDVSGMVLFEHLRSLVVPVPVIFIAQDATIATAVAAMKAGAFDFLEKPLDAAVLVERVVQAVDLDRRRRRAERQRFDELARLSQLTPREREVVDLVVAGKANKEIARALFISSKTVEFHRARAMKKVGARRTTDLVRIALDSRVAGEERISSQAV